jgi:hypothetical protein
MADAGTNNRAQANEDSSQLAKEVHWIQYATFWSQIGLALIGIVALCIYHGQLKQMIDSNNLTRSALAGSNQSLSETLAEMQEQVDATYSLYDEAQRQTKQTSILAGNAAVQARLARQQLALYTQTQVPFIFVRDVSQTIEPNGNDILVKWSIQWRNSGGSQPIGLKIHSTCHDGILKDMLDFSPQKIGVEATPVIAPQGDRTAAGCETSRSFLDEIRKANMSRTGSDPYKVFFLYGFAEYNDFLLTQHHIEFCYQLLWDNPNIAEGFHMIECTQPNNIHTCKDEECKDWTPQSRKKTK